MRFGLPFSLDALPQLSIAAVVDILLVAFVIYETIMLLRGRRAAPIVAGVGILFLLYGVATWLGLDLLRTILSYVIPYTGFALIVLFQSDIRRVLARIGRRRWLGWGPRLASRESTADILLAINQLHEDKTGALIVVEREIGLRSFIESGIRLDAQLSRDLMLAIFQHGGALHDGAVIVQGERISAAACFLPLSMNPTVARTLGTRHRAGIGITEETDCLSIIVSEETGRISIAMFGEIESDVTLERVEERLAQRPAMKKPPLRPVLPRGADGGMMGGGGGATSGAAESDFTRARSRE
jgi:diadenylate cyclase